MKKIGTTALLALLVVGLAITVIPAPKATVPSDGWTLIAQRGLKAYPDLMETVWQKNASAPPNGPFDIIGLHRVVKTGIPVGVLFICPGTWGSGEQLISNPPTCPLFPAHCPFPWSKLSPHVYNHKAKSSQLKKNPKNARK